MKLKHSIDCCVSGLLSASSPAAVARRVAQCVVFAIKREFWPWAFAHVAQKRIERICPFFTDPYASAAIFWVVAGVLVHATLAHRNPTPVRQAAALAMGCVVVRSALLHPQLVDAPDLRFPTEYSRSTPQLHLQSKWYLRSPCSNDSKATKEVGPAQLHSWFLSPSGDFSKVVKHGFHGHEAADHEVSKDTQLLVVVATGFVNDIAQD